MQPGTVDSNAARLREKLGAKNRAHLVDIAWRQGLLNS